MCPSLRHTQSNFCDHIIRRVRGEAAPCAGAHTNTNTKVLYFHNLLRHSSHSLHTLSAIIFKHYVFIKKKSQSALEQHRHSHLVLHHIFILLLLMYALTQAQSSYTLHRVCPLGWNTVDSIFLLTQKAPQGNNTIILLIVPLGAIFRRWHSFSHATFKHSH